MEDNNKAFEQDAENNLQDDADLEQVSYESEEFADEDNLNDAVAGVDTAKISEEIEEAKQEETAEERVKTVSAGGGSGSSLSKLFVLFGVIIALGAGLVLWKAKFAGHHGTDFNYVSKTEMELLLKDFNPMQLKQMSENPEQKEALVTNLKELLAVASQAEKAGFAGKEEIKEDLENMEVQLFALNYDKKINSDKGPMPPFGFIGEDRVKEFYGENVQTGGLSWIWNGAESRRREAEFQQFLNSRLEAARKSGQISKDQEPTEEELKELRKAFAKTRIYYEEAREKLNNLNSLPEAERKEWKEWEEKTELQIKLQKAQLLAQKYFEEVVKKQFEVSDEEVQKYIADHPELGNTAEKKKKAEEILKKVKEGGDFAELAKEFSEDPGSKNNGGLYEGISQGQFAPEFERAAMLLKPGEFTQELVKTNFGYHIIKLEKRGEAKGASGQAQPTYDVRHILISTMVKDPENPMGREVPAEQFVRAKLEKEKQEKVLNDIKANNPVEVENFEVPKVSDEEIKKLQEEQQKMMEERQKLQEEMMKQQQPPAGEDAPKEEKE